MSEFAEYCRQLEAYLCRKNDGHLIRIAGPVFQQVCGWAAQGVPLAIAFRGIDQYFERYYAKGPRRRPVRIEFCEGDILALFDDWRRAVGVSAAAEATAADEPARRGQALPSHVDRAIARLTALRAGGARSAGFDGVLDATVRELDRARAAAKSARGHDRAALVDRLAAMDAALVAAAIGELAAEPRAALRREAEAEIAPFASRMPAGARDEASRRAFERLVRDHFGLPVLTFA